MAATRQLLLQDGVRHAPVEGRVGRADASIIWRTLRGGLSEGVEVVTLSNGLFHVDVCPTRGMGILQAQFEGTRIGWESPVAAAVHPQFVNTKARNGLGWLDGFNELLCRCGLSCNGPPGVDEGARSPIESDLTLHGRIANIPAHFVEAGVDEASGDLWITGECRETTLFGPHLVLTSTVSIPLDGAEVRIDDTVTNRASTSTELELLYHINVGPPFLEEGSRFLAAFREMCPRDARAAEGVDAYAEYLGPTPGYAEQVYYFDTMADEDGLATVLLRNRSGNLGFRVTYDRRSLPCLSQWKCTQPVPDGYVTGLEPGTNFPNFKSFEREEGRVQSLEADASFRTMLVLGVHTSEAVVSSIAEAIVARQAAAECHVHRQPTQPFARV